MSRLLTFIAVSCLMVIVNVDMTSTNLVLANLTESLNASMSELEWFMNGYLLMATLSVFFTGRLVDYWGPRNVFLLGTVAMYIGSLISALSVSIPMIIVGRLFQGIGFGTGFSTAMLIATSIFPAERQGRGTGYAVLVNGLSQMIGPSLSAALILEWGWPAIFWFNLPLAGLSIILTLLYVPNQTLNRPIQPLLPKELLAMFSYKAILVSRATAMLVWSASLFILPLYLQHIVGVPLRTVSNWLLMMNTAFALLTPINGMWLDRYGARGPCTLAFVLSTIAFICLYQYAWTPHHLWLGAGLLCFGIHSALIVSGMIHATLKRVPDHLRGSGMGFFYTITFFGAFCGVTFAAWGMDSLGYYFVYQGVAEAGIILAPADLETLSNIAEAQTRLSALDVSELAVYKPMALYAAQQTFSTMMAVCAVLSGLVIPLVWAIKPLIHESAD